MKIKKEEVLASNDMYNYSDKQKELKGLFLQEALIQSPAPYGGTLGASP